MDRTLAARLIDLYNDEFVKVFAVVRRNARDEALRSDLGRFFSGSSGFAEVLRDVVIEANGRCNREQILQNLEAIRHSQKIDLLHRVLNEVLDFILFSAGEAMGYMDARAFEQQVQAILAEADREEGGAGGASHAAEAPRDKPPGRRTSVAIISYLPDDEAYQLASGLTACRAEATFARERAEQIVQLAKSDELREAALRCCEHAASAIRALDELDQRVARLRRR